MTGSLAGSIIDSVAASPGYGQALDNPWVIFHRKIRASGGDQEKSERNNSERTKAINPTPCGRSIGQPQAFVLSQITVEVG